MSGHKNGITTEWISKIDRAYQKFVEKILLQALRLWLLQIKEKQIPIFSSTCASLCSLIARIGHLVSFDRFLIEMEHEWDFMFPAPYDLERARGRTMLQRNPLLTIRMGENWTKSNSKKAVVLPMPPPITTKYKPILNRVWCGISYEIWYIRCPTNSAREFYEKMQAKENLVCDVIKIKGEKEEDDEKEKSVKQKFV